MSSEVLWLHFQMITDCWRAFREFEKTENVGQWNEQIGKIRKKYPDSEFCVDIIWAYTKLVAREAEKIRKKLMRERKAEQDDETAKY